MTFVIVFATFAAFAIDAALLHLTRNNVHEVCVHVANTFLAIHDGTAKLVQRLNALLVRQLRETTLNRLVNDGGLQTRRRRKQQLNRLGNQFREIIPATTTTVVMPTATATAAIVAITRCRGVDTGAPQQLDFLMLAILFPIFLTHATKITRTRFLNLMLGFLEALDKLANRSFLFWMRYLLEQSNRWTFDVRQVEIGVATK